MYSLDERLNFTCIFCSSRCPDLSSCKHRYDCSKCEPLFNALKENGFIEEQTNDELNKMLKQLPFEFLMGMCNCCERKMTCPDLYNRECRVIVNKVKEGLDIEKDKETQKEKMIQFPVNMDEMQRNILIALLNARKECTDENLLTARGCVAIIDALFYLVKEKPIYVGIDMGDNNGDITVDDIKYFKGNLNDVEETFQMDRPVDKWPGGLSLNGLQVESKKYACTATHCECTMCVPGPCDSRMELKDE